MESKVNQFINVVASLLKKQNASSFGDNIYFRDIPPKKLEKARKALNVTDEEEVLILFDDTAFGSAKDGMAVTTWGLRYKESEKWAVSWEDLYAHPLNIDTSGKKQEPWVDVLSQWNQSPEYIHLRLSDLFPISG